MSPHGQSADGSERNGSEESNSEEYGESLSAKYSESELEAQRAQLIREGNWRWPDTGKTSNEEARDSAQMLGIVMVYSVVVITGLGLGAYLIWGR